MAQILDSVLLYDTDHIGKSNAKTIENVSVTLQSVAQFKIAVLTG